MGHIRSGSVAAVAAAVVTGLAGGPAGATGQDQVPCGATALRTAIATASPGATLVLTSHCAYHLTSAYSGDDGLPAVDRRLTIMGQGATIVRDSATAGAFRILHVTSTGNLHLEDVTVRGGDAPDDGGGILVDGGGRLTLVKADVVDNAAGGQGGGVEVGAGATAVVKHSRLAYNNADTGGGLHNAGTLSVEDTDFSRDHARTTGGGVDQTGGSAVYSNSLIRYNTAASAGGGLVDDGGTVEFYDGKIANNTSSGLAGGVLNRARLTLIRAEVTGNVAGGTGGTGGGILNTAGGALVLRDSLVEGNSANGDSDAHAGGIWNGDATVTLDHTTVRGNASTVAPGGVWTDTPFTVRDSKILYNIPTNCTGSPVVVTGCLD
ncbi:hypothetical protein [Streptomyces sp. NPDC051452]|uniref:hypothetical protein n=1 Tax=Streptomyces sp. NPDC051452 TaxID=3365654 RepID=UPI0037A2E520